MCGVAQVEDHVLQVIYLPRWARIKRDDHLASKRVVEAMFALGVALHWADYLMEGNLRSYGLATIDEENVNPPHTASGSIVARPPAAKVASSGLSIRGTLPDAIPSSSTSMPPQVSAEAASQRSWFVL